MNAPSVFQRLMNKIFAEELGIFVLVYLDDILIFSENVEQHWQHLKVALARLRQAKLFGRIHKCTFLKDQVEYLGFDISAEGIKPSEARSAPSWSGQHQRLHETYAASWAYAASTGTSSGLFEHRRPIDGIDQGENALAMATRGRGTGIPTDEDRHDNGASPSISGLWLPVYDYY